MLHKRIAANATPTAAAADAWEPLRVALAQLVTAGDDGFVDQARADRQYDAPVVLAGCLAEEMERAGCIKRPGRPGEAPNFGPRLAELVENYDGRLRQLAEDFASSRLPQQSCDAPCLKLFWVFELRKFLERRIDEACTQICKRIKNGDLRASGVLLHRGVEHPADDIRRSAITETMCLGADGSLYQGPPGKDVPAWKSVEVAWVDRGSAADAIMPNRESQHDPIPAKKRGGGSKPKYDWPEIERKAYQHFDEEGFDQLADIEKFMAPLAVAINGDEASESVVREHASKVRDRLANRKAGN